MKAAERAKPHAHEGPVRCDLPFDEAMKRALGVKPPPGGWKAHDQKATRKKGKRRKK